MHAVPAPIVHADKSSCILFLPGSLMGGLNGGFDIELCSGCDSKIIIVKILVKHAQWVTHWCGSGSAW